MPAHLLPYRPEIDGLRAIAVLSVFAFHINRQWLPGGFVGVDIFFVISGYLITSVLYNDCKTGRFSLSRFLQRRIARIFPAFFAVALATIAGAAFVFTAQDYAFAGDNLVAASLSVANVKFMFQGNYFEVSPDAQPFLHYWSLSVEEQFYLIFPVLLFLIFRYATRHLSQILALLGIGSLIACVLYTRIDPIWAFYVLPTRAWELAAGSLMAVIPLATIGGRAVTTPRWLSTLGVLLIACSFALIHEGPEFPGWRALFPVAGTVAIILSRANSENWTDKWLSSRPMVNIGKMSYSLYLWHWPILSLIDYQFFLLSSETRLALKIVLTFLLAALTSRFIEIPARIFLNRPGNGRVAFAFLAAGLALCVPLGTIIRQNNYVNAEFADVANGGLVYPGTAGAPTVVLMGDSNGSMYGKVMKEICADLGQTLTVISVAAGDPLPQQRIGESGKLWFDSLQAIRKIRPDYLVLANHWLAKLHGEPTRLALVIEELKPYVGHLILLNQPPILPKDANRAHFRAGVRPPFLEPKDAQANRRMTNEILLSFQSKNVSVIDVSRHFETNEGEIILTDERGRLLYQDATHLSGRGAERIRDVLKQAISNR
jgi:peptidoglycan/LPS O-acetylase OafA/YrhL